VPNYITSNSFIANSYAQVIFALIHDYFCNESFDGEGEVVNIIELGSGTGKFAYLLLKHLTASLEANPPLHPKSQRPIKFRYGKQTHFILWIHAFDCEMKLTFVP